MREVLRRYPENLTAGEVEAVRQTIEQTRQMSDGENRVAIIDMVFFKKTHTLRGAALRIPCDYETAKRWQRAFMRMVAEKRGLMA